MSLKLSFLEKFMIRRFRKIYSECTGFVSVASDYDGLVEEMKYSLSTFSLEQRLEFDARTLPRVISGRLAPLTRWFARKFPRVATKCFLALFPVGLEYLIGPSSKIAQENSLIIPRCRFLEQGGESLCQHVCKSPTEHFFAQEYHLDIRFSPSLTEGHCRLDFK